MLQNIRDNASGALVMIVVGLIVLAMMSGAGMVAANYGGEADPVIEIGETQYYQPQVEALFEQAKTQYPLQQQQYLQYGIELPDRTDKELLDELIDQQLVVPAVKRNYSAENFAYPESAAEKDFWNQPEIAAATTKEEKKAAAQRVLRTANRTYEQQIEFLKASKIPNQFTNGVKQSAFLTKSELEQALTLQQQTRDIEVLRFAASDFKDQVTPTEEDLEEYYNANQDEYLLPARVKVAYVELTADQYQDKVIVTDEALTEWYAANESRYTKPEQRQVSHILIETDSDTDDAAAKQQAEEVVAKLAAGEEFAALAAEYSDDTLSKDSGGALGWLRQGDIGADFDNAAFSAEAGEVVGPVKQDDHYHVIVVNDIRAPGAPELAEVKDKVTKAYKEETAQAMLNEQVTQLGVNQLEFDPDSLEQLIDEADIEIKQSDWLNADATTGIMQYPEVRAAAFNDELLGEDKLLSEIIQTANGERAYVLQNTAYEPESVQTLESVKAKVTEAVTVELSQEKAEEVGQQAIARIEAGENPAEVAEALGGKFTENKTALKQGSGLSQPVATAAFKLPQPDSADKASVTGISENTSDYAVVVVKAVYKPSDIAETQRSNIESSMQRLEGNVDFATVERIVVADADVEVDIDREALLLEE